MSREIRGVIETAPGTIVEYTVMLEDEGGCRRGVDFIVDAIFPDSEPGCGTRGEDLDDATREAILIDANERAIYTDIDANETLDDYLARKAEQWHPEEYRKAMRSRSRNDGRVSRDDKEADVMQEHLGKLVGRTVTGLLYDPGHDVGTIWGLEFDDGKAGAFILCDPEGNGPGHLEIVIKGK